MMRERKGRRASSPSPTMDSRPSADDAPSSAHLQARWILLVTLLLAAVVFASFLSNLSGPAESNSRDWIAFVDEEGESAEGGFQHRAPVFLKPEKTGQSCKDDAEELGDRLVMESRRFALHVALDKVIYRPGDLLYVRAVALDVKTHKPVTGGFSSHDQVDFFLTSDVDEGKPLPGTRTTAQLNGTAFAGRYQLPRDFRGGEYYVIMEQTTSRCGKNRTRMAPGFVQVQVRTDSQSNAKLSATLEVTSLSETSSFRALLREVTDLRSGRKISHPHLKSRCRVTAPDGRELWTGQLSLNDETGFHEVSFSLPEEARFEPMFTAHVTFAGLGQTFSAPVPTAPFLTVFPAGGFFIPGVENDVFLEFTTSAGRVAHFEGSLIESCDGAVKNLGALEVNLGRAKTTFTFQPDCQYRLSNGQEIEISNSDVLAEGVSIIPISGLALVEHGRLELRLVSKVGKDQKFVLEVLRKESALVRSQPIVFDKPIKVLKLDSIKTPQGGVLRVVVSRILQDHVLPVAERLVFARPSHQIAVELKNDENVLPGSRVQLEVHTSEAASLALRVTDFARTSMAHPQDRPLTLPNAVLLGNELKNTASTTNDAKLLDLLLGVQGWRRHLYANITDSFIRAESFVDKVRLASVLGINLKKVREDEFLAIPMMMMARGEVNPVDRGAVLGFPALNMEMADEDGVAAAAAQIGDDFDAGVAGVAPPDGEFLPRFKRFRPSSPAMYIHRSSRKSSRESRSDFEGTLLWVPFAKTALKRSKHVATFSFDASDLISTFAIDVDAWSDEGFLGSASTTLTVSKPVSTDVELPVAVIIGDKVEVPVSFSTKFLARSFKGRHNFEGNMKAFETRIDSTRGSRIYLEFAPTSAGRKLLQLETFLGGMMLRADDGAQMDKVAREMVVELEGFPVNLSKGGLISANEDVSWSESLPEDVTDFGIELRAELFLSPLSQLLRAIKQLLRDPCGCFEQTSSTVYPMLLALRWLRSLNRGFDSEVQDMAEDARTKLEVGYVRLLSFETSTGGFEWFGESPGHEALTAYGLLQFAEFQKALPGLVDETMWQRTKEWLLQRREPSGGFARNEKSLDSFGRAPVRTTNAYIIWSLVRSGAIDASELDAQLEKLKKDVEKFPDDPYIRALAGAVLSILGRRSEGLKVLEHLAAMQDSNGCIGEEAADWTTITNSRGISRKIEATALSAIAWMDFSMQEVFSDNIILAIKCIQESVSSGTYGNTQATALALQALVAFNEKTRATISRATSFKVSFNGNGKVSELPLKDAFVVTETFHLQSSSAKTFSIAIELVGADEKAKFPFLLSANYFVRTPESSPQSTLKLSTEIPNEAQEGDLITMTATIVNLENNSVFMPIAVLGLPAGVEPDLESLRSLVKDRTNSIAKFETLPNRIILYSRGLGANESQTVHVSLLARFPGVYTTPASSVWLFYASERRSFVEGKVFKVVKMF